MAHFRCTGGAHSGEAPVRGWGVVNPKKKVDEPARAPCKDPPMAGADRKRQKKLEKNRKKRQLAKKDARKLEAKYQGANLLRLATSAPFGPCWVSV